ncbi:MAG: hypothetical protein ACM3ML_23985 [Micromonosporaceae bacterium]
MIFLGIVIVALAAGGAAGVIADNANNSGGLTLNFFGAAFHGMNIAEVFLIGMGVACLFLLGCGLTLAGVRRSVRMRRELRDLREQQDESMQMLLAEKAQLERELARQRNPRPDTLVARPISPAQ